MESQALQVKPKRIVLCSSARARFAGRARGEGGRVVKVGGGMEGRCPVEKSRSLGLNRLHNIRKEQGW